MLSSARAQHTMVVRILMIFLCLAGVIDSGHANLLCEIKQFSVIAAGSMGEPSCPMMNACAHCKHSSSTWKLQFSSTKTCPLMTLSVTPGVTATGRSISSTTDIRPFRTNSIFGGLHSTNDQTDICPIFLLVSFSQDLEVHQHNLRI